MCEDLFLDFDWTTVDAEKGIVKFHRWRDIDDLPYLGLYLVVIDLEGEIAVPCYLTLGDEVVGDYGGVHSFDSYTGREWLKRNFHYWIPLPNGFQFNEFDKKQVAGYVDWKDLNAPNADIPEEGTHFVVIQKEDSYIDILYRGEDSVVDGVGETICSDDVGEWLKDKYTHWIPAPKDFSFDFLVPF